MCDITQIDHELSNFVNKKIEWDCDVITDIFRKLRAYCTQGPSSQNEITDTVKVLDNTIELLTRINSQKERSGEWDLCLRVGFQFLVNLIVNNKSAGKLVWNSGETLFKHSIYSEDGKVQTCTCMILYNLLLLEVINISSLTESLDKIIDMTQNESTSEFPMYLLEFSLQNQSLMEKYYENLEPNKRLIMLEVIKEMINDNNKMKSLPTGYVDFLGLQFKHKSDRILKTVSSYVENVEPQEVTKILDILATLSGYNELPFLSQLQTDKSLLINCVFLLKSIHNIGKADENNFTMIQKAADLSKMEKNNELQQHPAFGFKATLIRVIGNLCWEHKINQDLVRELEGIQLLLDCCNIDARNPFIIQWTILSVKNLCYNNIENQQVIASLSKQGNVDSRLLNEMGVTLSSNDGSSAVCMAPLKSSK